MKIVNPNFENHAKSVAMLRAMDAACSAHVAMGVRHCWISAKLAKQIAPNAFLIAERNDGSNMVLYHLGLN
jgi:hypothetical protein